MDTKILLIFLAFVAIFGLIISCSEDNQLIKTAVESELLAIDRDNSVLATEVFEMTANDGSCYAVTLEWLADGSVRHSKLPISCSSNAVDYKGVYFTHSVEPDVNGRIKLDDGNTYWYIPLTGTQVFEISGHDLICFCEVVTPNSFPGSLDPCGPDLAECHWRYTGPFKTCVEGGCCDDCDLRVCTAMQVGDSTVFDKANGIVARASFVRNVYYGSNTKIEISRQGGTVFASRTSLQGAPHPRNLVNLTTLPLVNGEIIIPSGGNYWFIPFETSVAAVAPTDGPRCRPDTGDCTECELRVGKTGCDECFCKEGRGTGDCDMVPNSHGGILVEATTINLTDH